MLPTSSDFQHGLSGYSRGCKCEACRLAKRDYMRVWRSRRREQDAAEAGAEPLVDRAEAGEERPPLVSVPTIDLKASAGTIESAFDQDLNEPAGDVLWKHTLIAMARFNARIMDQVVDHGRLDLVPSVQLRMSDFLNRLAYLKTNGHLDGRTSDPDTAPDSASEVDKEAARLLAELEGGA